MFDANMRHIPKGKKFFVKVCGVSELHKVRELDLKCNVVLCEMLSEDNDNPIVRFFDNNTSVDISDEESGIGSWIKYEGNTDGSGFISEDSWELAYEVMVEIEGEVK